MGQPAHEVTSRRDRLVFLLTLVAVVVTAALLGYLLGHYAFSRWVGLPPAPAPRLAELGLAPLGAAPPAEGVEPAAPAPADRTPAPSPAPASAPALRPDGAPSAAPPVSLADAGTRPQLGPPAVQAEGQARAEGYFVQVAAFSQPALAQRALRQLTEQGYDARVVSTRGPDGRELYYKVWVGPYGRREQAVAARERLRAQWPNAWIP